jgi:hypothetical protein
VLSLNYKKLQVGRFMRYKITEHYARGEEKVIAEFSELKNAHFFIAKKIAYAEEEEQKIIYRLYDDSELLQQFNKENISVAHAKYADGSGDLNLVQLPFNVMIKGEDSLEKKSIANFNLKNNAYLFIDSQFASDHINDNDLFFIYQEQNLIDTLNKIISTHRNQDVIRTQNREKKATFHPTPLPTRPTLPGGPKDCWIEKDEDS